MSLYTFTKTVELAAPQPTVEVAVSVYSVLSGGNTRGVTDRGSLINRGGLQEVITEVPFTKPFNETVSPITIVRSGPASAAGFLNTFTVTSAESLQPKVFVTITL